MLLLSADTNIVMIATENEINMATILICTLINSVKILFISSALPKSNNRAAIKEIIPTEKGNISLSHIRFLD